MQMEQLRPEISRILCSRGITSEVISDDYKLLDKFARISTTRVKRKEKGEKKKKKRKKERKGEKK